MVTIFGEKMNLLLFASFFINQSDAKKKKPTDIEPPQPNSNFYLRTSFDKDPSMYLGRFILDGSETIDETAARKSQCTELISIRYIDAGNVLYDEVMKADVSLGAQLKIPGVDSISVGANQNYGVRTTYTLNKKMVADIEDPYAFEKCCRESETNCTSRYIGEFLEGSGSLWSAHSQFVGVKFLDKLQKKLPVDVEAHGEYNWVKSRVFDENIYFAYKITELPKFDCNALIDKPPKSSDGLYFGGLSDPMKSERHAKEKAMDFAKEQMVRYIAEDLQIEITEDSTVGAGPSGEYSGGENRSVTRYAQGITSKVKADLYCPTEVVETPDGPLYTARVIAFIPNESLDWMRTQLFGE